MTKNLEKMIKIDKDLNGVPPSLQLPERQYFSGTIPRPPKTTHQRRRELIDQGKYIDTAQYNSRYKQSDTKEALKLLYHNKCAYCEQVVEQTHVEHYRPKSTYYWLAYSWDNLLLSCPTCNKHKDVNFQLDGPEASLLNAKEALSNIHALRTSYDDTELPRLVNPEVTDVSGQIVFNQSGNVDSADSRLAYTIEVCKIDRATLNDQRKKLLEVFARDVRSALLEASDTNKQELLVGSIITKFIRDSCDNEMAFLAFRRFAIASNWLKEIIIEVKRMPSN